MYSSLKSWMNVLISIRPFISYSGTGSKRFGSPVDILCYPVHELKVVRNAIGEEVVSDNHLYIDGTVAIKDTDIVVYNGNDYTIQQIGVYFRNGAPDAKVVYI